MKTRLIHSKLSVRGAIRNRDFGIFQHPDGRKMSRREAEENLLEALSNGIEYLPLGDCPDFDPKTGCPGHDVETEPAP